MCFFSEILSMLMWMDLMRANQTSIPRLPMPSEFEHLYLMYLLYNFYYF